MSSIPTDVKIHPTVIFSIVDSYERRNEKMTRVVGTLLGSNIQGNIEVTDSFVVPHRDEFSETVGFKIMGDKKSALYIPDIDKWKIWEKDIIAEVKAVDYAFIDGTFFEEGEINRPIKDVPHPFITETVSLFKNEQLSVKQKIYFIHLNHTNPAHNKTSPQRIAIEKQGFRFASLGSRFMLN
jgi:pyrroloquinoline quinone biosynthesis protein B